MEGVYFEKAGAALAYFDTLAFPDGPSTDQILVKSLYTAINPVDAFIGITGGLLVDGYPISLGVDAAGVVVKVGEKASAKFKVGDEVCGCTRLGARGYSTAAEFFLMDAEVTILKPKNITIQQAATIGVGTETACLGLFNGLNIDLPSIESLRDPVSNDEDSKDDVPKPEKDVPGSKDEPSDLQTVPPESETVHPAAKPQEPDSQLKPANPTTGTDDYIIILGGASSVGKYAIQLAIACGYKVCTSCSASSAEIVRDLADSAYDAADVHAITLFDYKKPLAEQVKDVMVATQGNFCRIFDAVGCNDELATILLRELHERAELVKAVTGSQDTTNEPKKEIREILRQRDGRGEEKSAAVAGEGLPKKELPDGHSTTTEQTLTSQPAPGHETVEEESTDQPTTKAQKLDSPQQPTNNHSSSPLPQLYFTTTNPMSDLATSLSRPNQSPPAFSHPSLPDPLPPFPTSLLKTHNIQLAPIGRPESHELNKLIASYIPVIVTLIEQEKLVPSAYDVVGTGGFHDVIEAYNYQQKGAGGANKVLVKIQDR